MGIAGSCICGSVQYRVSGEPKAVVNCHCNFCRSHSGAVFSCYLVVLEEALEVMADADFISSHEIRDGARKHFCRQCGTPLYNRNAKYPGLNMIYLGTAQSAAGYVPTANIYCESQLAWIPQVGEFRNFPQAITKKA